MSKLLNICRILLRNIIRYKKNYIIMFAIGISVFFIIFLSCLTAGIQYQLKELMYSNYSGDILLVSEEVEFKSNPEPIQVGWNKMIHSGGIYEKIKQQDGIKEIYRRLIVMASVMGEDDEKNEYASVIGCDFKKEEDFSFVTLLKFVEKKDPGPDGIYISEKMAEKLDLKLSDNIYLIFIGEGEVPVPAQFIVAGIFTGKGFPTIADKTIYVDYDALKKKLLYGEEKVSYLLLTLRQQKQKESVINTLEQVIPADWKIVGPDQSGQIFISIIITFDFILGICFFLMYLSIFLFVYSSLFINIKGRHREIGIMSSMGISKKNTFLIFTVEGILIGLIPSVIGSLLGIAIILIISLFGIPAVNDSLKYAFASDVLFPRLNSGAVLIAIVGISCIAFIASIFPTLKILKLRPVDALHEFQQ